MKCPNCGYEMSDEHLYCEKCGNEIQIVPDFEPELENSITETLSTVAEEIEGRKDADKSFEDNVPANDTDAENALKKHSVGKKLTSKKSSGHTSKTASGKNSMVASFVIFVIVVILTILTGLFFYQRYSVSYQISRAGKYVERGNYEEAASYLEKALKLEPGQTNVVLALSNNYCLCDEKQKALELLLKHIDTVVLETEDKEVVYGKIIALYEEEERYEEINSLLLKCDNVEVQTRFQQYMAMTPEFNYIAGSYDKIIPLKISVNTTGTIYYTLDGSDPDENSMIYTSPIFLESGEYQVGAVFVNDYGIKSNVARNWYMINLTVPEQPEVLLYSGEYHQLTMIEVTVPKEGTVYYTTDGSNPSSDSLVYTGPIQMPLGKSNFKFVTISEEGVASEIVSRSFDFDLKTEVSVQQAIVNVISALYNRGVLKDLQGHSFEIEGRYVFEYDTIVEIPDLGYYYVLKEFEETASGSKIPTERLYAVEVYTGAPNRLTYDEIGQMGLIPLS